MVPGVGDNGFRHDGNIKGRPCGDGRFLQAAMLIDWDNPPSLPCPKRAQRDPRDRERLAAVQARRRLHKPSKAHNTTKRAKAISKAKRARIAANLTRIEAERLAYLAAAKAYWLGRSDGHP
jgi:hypothetical protein